MTEALFVAPSPVFTVGQQVRGELARDLMRLQVEEAADGLKTLSARFLAFGPREGSQEEQLLYLDGRLFDFGKQLDVAIGPAGGARTIFRGRLSAIEAAFEEGAEPEVTILAEDRLMDLRMTRRMRTYEAMSDADVVREIAGFHNLTPDVDAAGPTYDRVQQWNQSDLAFLRERARLIQAEVWLEGGDTLCFKSPGRRAAPQLTLVRGNQLISLEVRADLAHQRTAVHLSGYDAARRAAIDQSAGSEAIAAEISTGRSGPQVLQQAFGARVSHRVREVPLNDGEAREWVRQEMLRRCRGFVCACGVTSGSPEMTVGSVLTLERVGAPFEGGGYHVTRVCHTFDLSSGHRTCFEAQRAVIEEAT